MRFITGILLYIITLVGSSSTVLSQGQEINFGDYYNYSATLTPINNLDFGVVVNDSGVKTFGISESATIMLEGVKYLDVIVTITPENLQAQGSCTGNCEIEFTLEASYANFGSDNIVNATQMAKIGDIATARFPILQRTNGPPGPPPTPVHGDNPVDIINNPNIYETAYIYIYGSINVPSLNASGLYVGTIEVRVEYD
jgi:hypothetical protein